MILLEEFKNIIFLKDLLVKKRENPENYKFSGFLISTKIKNERRRFRKLELQTYF